MSEPKWWPKGTVPTEPGWYQSRLEGVETRVSWLFPEEDNLARNRDGFQDLQFYGPIPEPPKEPPKLRRFTATHKQHGRVSGVYVEPSPKDPGSYLNFSIWYVQGDGYRQVDFCRESDFCGPIQWLDKE